MPNEKKKNIAIMVNSLSTGGAERVMADLSLFLEQNGYNVHMLVMDDAEPAFKFGGKLHRIGFVYAKAKWWMTLLSWQHLIGTSRLKRKLKIDLTISAMEYLNLINLLTGKDEKITTLHNYRFQSEVTPTKKDRFIEWLYAKLSKRNKSIVCVSRGIEEKAKLLYPGVKTATIYNGSNLELIEKKQNELPLEYKEEFNIKEAPTFEDKIIVNVGRLTEQKNQAKLIEAFALLKKNHAKARLIIVGEGHLESELQALAKRLNISEAVLFVGNTENPFYYMKNASMFVLSSDYEGFGNVVVEALCCGTPVVSVDCKCGPREILSPESDIDEVTSTDYESADFGVLTNPSSTEALTKGIEKLLTDEHLWEDYKCWAKHRGKDFDINITAKKWLEIIEG